MCRAPAVVILGPWRGENESARLLRTSSRPPEVLVPVAVMCARDSFLSERLADQRGSGIALLSRGLLDENVRYLGAA